jgi:hypothetical protein
VGTFLKVFDDIKLRDDAALQLSVQGLPEIVIIEKEKFSKLVAEYESNQQRSKRIRKLFDETVG